MGWTLLIAVVLALSGVSLVAIGRRRDLRRLGSRLEELDEAERRGTRRARLQFPHVDLTRCLGCGTCIRACPEDGVLELIHGQAIVLHGARCVGHGLCAQECPTGAIAIALADVAERRDLPALDTRFEVPSVPGLFLAGEVTGYALIRTAIAHGTAIANEVAGRVRRGPGSGGAAPLDLCIVGAGPAGLACALEARRLGLDFVVLEQEEIGGTVAKYPRRKLVMTQPVELPLHGRLARTQYEKEELMELWTEVVADHDLPIRTGARFTNLEQAERDGFVVHTEHASVEARFVCLALGRRGTPRKLGVPGEDLPKVAYALLDAQSYRDQHVLVVGGGDSAVEAAVGLAAQDGNQVTLSYRRASFFRLKAANEARLDGAQASGKLRVAFESEVERIDPDTVDLRHGGGVERIPNDQVFVLAGGIPPFELLERVGVSFDPKDRPTQEVAVERGTGFLRALLAALALSLLTLAWAIAFRGYYMLPLAERPFAPEHPVLRPAGDAGLLLGIGSAGLMAANLAYLARRAFPRIRLGSLRAWMTAHVVTGILALLTALLHGALGPRNALGGHALAGLTVLVVTGAIGRYLYSFVPRAANGRELELSEVRGRLAALSEEWDACNRAFGERVRQAIDDLVASGRWRSTFLGRLWAVVGVGPRLRNTLERLRREARDEGLAPEQIRELMSLARRAQRTALMAAHYEDLRGLMASWRHLHRWVALLVVLLVVLHVLMAVRFGELG